MAAEDKPFDRVVAAFFRAVLLYALVLQLSHLALQIGPGSRIIPALMNRSPFVYAALVESYRGLNGPAGNDSIETLSAEIDRVDKSSLPIGMVWASEESSNTVNHLKYRLYPRFLIERYTYSRTSKTREVTSLAPKVAADQATDCQILWRSQSDIDLTCPDTQWHYSGPESAAK